ncbi:MAG TPA: hypothetical protein VFU81_06240, partial [Thermomicrobiales bacterium]|nr:hypothetical protein [Thermomicrobiales bacterium]
ADPALREAYVARNRSILAAGLVDGASYADATGSFIRAALADIRSGRDGREAAGDSRRDGGRRARQADANDPAA